MTHRVAAKYAASKAYEQRLKEPVSKEDAAAHRNLLKTHLIPLDKALSMLLRAHGQPGDVFERDELRVIQDMQRLLARKSVPVSSLKIEKDKPLLLL